MSKKIDHGNSGLVLGQRVMVRVPSIPARKGSVVGYGQRNKNPFCVRVQCDGVGDIHTYHQKFLHPNDPDLT